MIENLIVFGAMVLFAISALGNAYEASERKRTDNDNS